MTRVGGMVERMPERAVRWAGLMCGDVGAVVVVVLPATLTSRMRAEMSGVRVVKTRCLERRRMLAWLVGERTSSSLRRMAKPRAAVVLVVSEEEERRFRRVVRIWVVLGERRRIRALESQKRVLMVGVVSWGSWVVGGRRVSKREVARSRSSLLRCLLM